MVTVAALLVAAVGCGGDDDSQSTAASAASKGASNGSSPESGTDESGSTDGGSIKTSSLSQEEFAMQASAKCRRNRTGQLEEISAFIKEDPKQNETVKVIFEEVLRPKIAAELEIIRSLGAPEGDEEEIEAILAAQESAVEEVRQLPEPESFEELEPYFEDATEMMREYGFTACTGF